MVMVAQEFDFDELYARRDAKDVPGPIQFMRRWLVSNILRSEIPPGRRILEVGCGLGELTWVLTEQGYNVDACDLSVRAIQRAKNRSKAGRRPNFFLADAMSFCAPGQYDAILCLEVLEHLLDDAVAVRNLADSLKPGGILVCSVPHSMELWSLSDEIMGHLRRYTRQEMRTLLEAAGLSVKRLFTWGYPLVKTYAELRRATARPVRGYSGLGKGVEMYTPQGMLMALYRRFAFLLNRLFLVDVFFLDRDMGIGLIGLACKDTE